MNRTIRSLLACVAILVLPSSSTSAGWIDTFDGGLQQSWTFAGGTSVTYTAGANGNVLQMEDQTSLVNGGTNFLRVLSTKTSLMSVFPER